jgi:hypothetical protein
MNLKLQNIDWKQAQISSIFFNWDHKIWKDTCHVEKKVEKQTQANVAMKKFWNATTNIKMMKVDVKEERWWNVVVVGDGGKQVYVWWKVTP